MIFSACAETAVFQDSLVIIQIHSAQVGLTFDSPAEYITEQYNKAHFIIGCSHSISLCFRGIDRGDEHTADSAVGFSEISRCARCEIFA